MGLNWVWCGICAKYLAFGTYPTSAVGALDYKKNENLLLFLFFYFYLKLYFGVG